MIKAALEKLRAADKRLVAVFVFAVLLRWVYALTRPESAISPDAHDWMNLGDSISRGLGMGGSWRPPGYAGFLGALFFVTGKSLAAVRVVNGLLGGFTCLLAFYIGSRMIGARAGLIAAALYSFYPYSLAYSGDALSEPFLTFMIAAALALSVRASRDPSWKSLAAAGFVMGLTGLTKSTTLPFFLFACAWLWWRTGRLRAPLIAGAFTLLAIMPWSLRNYFFYDKSYVMPVNTPWYSFYGASCDEALWQENRGELDEPQTDESNSPAIPKDWDYVSNLPLPERDKYCKAKALSWIKENPGKFRYLVYRRALHFWRLYPMMAWPWQKYAAMATSGLYIPLALLGFFLWRRKLADTSLFLGVFFFYTLVHVFFVTTLRYRTPIDTFIIVMAAAALDAAWSRLRPSPGEGEASA